MKKSKLLLSILAVLLVAALICALAACKDTQKPTNPDDSGQTEPSGDPTDNPSGGQVNPNPDVTPVDTSIPTPTGLAAENDTVTWKRGSDTTVTFELDVNGTVINVGSRAIFNVKTYSGRPADGVFTLRVRAVKEDKASDWSAAIHYTYVGDALRSPTVSGLEGTVLKWSTPPENTLYPSLTVAGTEYKLAADATQYDLASVTADSDITLTFMGDGVYDLNSATVRLRYHAAAHSLAFAAPANVHMEGDVLCFDEAVGANTYYVRDVYNTVTSLTFEEISALSSDRNGHFLVQSIWVGSTDNKAIADSEPSDVVYFTADQGKGTEAEPFLIKSANDMRYIEYYEAMGQPCHYRLANDIEFAAYSPKKDEEYSNFYNLGSLSGVLDGNGHSIKNIVVYYKDGYSSIFDNITLTGVIKNLVIADTDWRTWTVRTNDGVMHEKGGECAVLAYTNRGTVENVTLASGTITAAKDGAAGLVSINRGTIRNCSVQANVTVTGVNEVGAIAIYNVGTVERCQNYGSVVGGSTVGGIVGRNAGTVTMCRNAGTVTGVSVVGGIVGYNYNLKDGDSMQYNTNVSYCVHAMGAMVSGVRYVGGLVGRNGSTGVNELGDGLYDIYGNAGVYGCYSQGDVVGAYSVGGLVGENNAYYDAANHFGLYACYSTGDLLISSKRRVLYFTKPNDWGTVYAYAWNNESKANEGAWPGTACTEVTTNTYGQKIYRIVTSVDSDYIIFNDGGNNKTPDIELNANSYAFYLDNGSVGTVGDQGYATDATIGYLTGLDNMVNDCYYAKPFSNDLPSDVNVSVGGVVPERVIEINSAYDMTAMVSTLNGVLGVDAFALADVGYPLLAWEKQQQE